MRSFPITAVFLLVLPPVSRAEDEKRFVTRMTFKNYKMSALAMTSDSRHLLFGVSTGGILMWNVPNDRFVTLEYIPAHARAVSCAAFSDDDKWLATGGVDGTVQLWETYAIARFQDECQNRKEGAAKPPNPRPKKTFPAHMAGVIALAYFPDGKRLATSGPDGAIKVWNVEAAAPKLAFSIAAGKGAVNSLAISPDGELIASAGADKTAKIWKAAPGSAKPKWTLTGHEGPVLAVAFSADGKKLATGSGIPKKSGQLRVWEVETGKEDYKLGEIGDVVTTVCFHPKLPRLAAGGKDKRIRVFNTETKKQLYADEHVEGLIKVMIAGDGGLLGSICPEEAKYWRGSPKVGE